MGAFSAKFLTPPSGKTMDGTQKSFRPKMMARTTSITMQNFVEIADARRRERTKCDVFHFLFLYFYFFVNNASRPSTALVRSLVTSTLPFEGRFRRCLQRFFQKKSPFQRMEQFSKR